MDITIRKGNETDLEKIFLLIKEFSIFQKTPEKLKITLEQMQQEKDLFQCYVAETDSGEIIGYACFFFAYYSWTGKSLYLDDLYVKQEYRGYKTGSKLLDTIIAYAKKEKCKRMRWQVSSWNTNAIDFYKKIGADINEVEFTCDLNLNQT